MIGAILDAGSKNTLTMYMGDPHKVAAIMLLWRYRAKPKSAVGQEPVRTHLLLLVVAQTTI